MQPIFYLEKKIIKLFFINIWIILTCRVMARIRSDVSKQWKRFEQVVHGNETNISYG